MFLVCRICNINIGCFLSFEAYSFSRYDNMLSFHILESPLNARIVVFFKIHTYIYIYSVMHVKQMDYKIKSFYEVWLKGRVAKLKNHWTLYCQFRLFNGDSIGSIGLPPPPTTTNMHVLSCVLFSLNYSLRKNTT